MTENNPAPEPSHYILNRMSDEAYAFQDEMRHMTRMDDYVIDRFESILKKDVAAARAEGYNVGRNDARKSWARQFRDGVDSVWNAALDVAVKVCEKHDQETFPHPCAVTRSRREILQLKRLAPEGDQP